LRLLSAVIEVLEPVVHDLLDELAGCHLVLGDEVRGILLNIGETFTAAEKAGP